MYDRGAPEPFGLAVYNFVSTPGMNLPYY